MLQDLKHFFRLSRPVNVLISGVVLAFSAYIATAHRLEFFRHKEFWIALGSLCMISATGYWINDVFDFKIDRVNKPGKTIVNSHLSAKKVFTVYFSVVGTLLFLTWFLQPFTLFMVNLSTVFSLFAYAAWLKRFSVVGNLLIGALAGMVIYYGTLLYGFSITLVWMTMFAFEITFIREVTKDIEDIKGDLQYKLQTLPIRIGIRSTKIFLLFCYALFILSCFIPFVADVVREEKYNWNYLWVTLLFVQLPAAWVGWKMSASVKTPDFRKQSLYLKLLILPGLASLLLI